MKKLYTIYDTVAGFYSPVFQAENDAHAIRMFTQSIDFNHRFDFALWHCADFDSDTGQIHQLVPQLITHGKNLKERQQ